MKLLFTILLILSISISTNAQESNKVSKDSTHKSHPKRDSLVKDIIRVNDKVYRVMQYSPAPIISYSTETSWVFGLAKFNAFDLNKKDTISKASSVSEIVGFSFNGQMYLDVAANFHWNENKNIGEFVFGLEKFPRQFWGVGNDIDPETSALVTKSFLDIRLNYKRMVLPNFFIGAKYNYYNVFDIKYTIDSLHHAEAYRGYDGGLNSGFGGIVAYDTRDNIYNSTKGMFIQFDAEFYSKAFGSDFVFNRYRFDIRKYHPVGKFTFAYQVFTESNFGDIPIYSVAMMGGSYRMRGYYEGQYRDKVLIDGQFEIRRHLFWILGATAFVSAGQVGPTYADFNKDNIHMTAGGGLRLMVDKVHKTNLRFDMGFGQNTFTFFFGFSEAF
ncbi:MAG: BamA/TamA family outer membrane protein [Bacteroidales bacterium]|nr:BamA/TamA family outer membrane protein [Bacteroidales bacterium]